MARVNIPTDKKVWFITGVSTGLGRTLTETALSHGDYVVGTVRDEGQIKTIEHLAPGRALSVLGDGRWGG